MKKLDLGQTITILANMGVIGGILLLAYELRQNNLYLQEQARFNVFQNRVDANVLFAENTEIARLWNWREDDGPLSDLDRARLDDLFHTVILRWQYDYQTLQLGVVGVENFPEEMMRLTWRERPHFVEVWRQRSAGYSPDFVEWMEENIVNR